MTEADKLELEAKKMEEQLEQIRKFKEAQGSKSVPQTTMEGTKWRSATQSYKIHGYEKQLMNHVEKQK